MEKISRRTQYTERVIREACLEMLQEMPPEKITVSELCRRADINRGTFYLHYRDSADLLETMGTELADELGSRLETMLSSGDALRDGMQSLMKILSRENGEGALLFSNEKSKCYDRIFRHSKQMTVESWLSRSSLSRSQAELLFEFLSGGGYAVSKAAYEGTLETSAEDSELIFQMISDGINSIVHRLP
jgi:AcrR family transcriptional regulator